MSDHKASPTPQPRGFEAPHALLSRRVAAEGMVLLENSGFRRDRIAVEINGEIIKKSDYDKTVLNDGDKIEVVSFVGGG